MSVGCGFYGLRAQKIGKRSPAVKLFNDVFHLAGRILTLPPERGRSPPAARLSVEGVWRIPESLHRLNRCGPGRSAVRRWRCQDAHHLAPRALPGSLANE